MSRPGREVVFARGQLCRCARYKLHKTRMQHTTRANCRYCARPKEWDRIRWPRVHAHYLYGAGDHELVSKTLRRSRVWKRARSAS